MNKKAQMQQLSPCYCTKIRKASRSITQHYINILKPSGLKITQFALLNNLRRNGPLTMNNLSEATNLERTTLIRNLRPLENKKFIQIISQENSKANLICLTESGEQKLTEALPYWEKAQKSIEEMLSNEEIENFDKTLKKLASINL
ncbi:MAG: MarR family winged helix-turn-helix transcriptional regulator [Eubacteriaceae bacterium]